jgi:type VI secretion system protein ImpL
MSLGLYQGRKLDAAADVGYQHLLDHALMPRVVRRLEERLRAVNKDNLEQAYEALKNYLMIYTPDKFDADSFKAYVGVDWDAALERTLAPDQRQALDQHLDAMLTHGAPPPAVAMDKNLVAGVRDMLVAFPLEYRVFSRLKRAQIGADIPAFTVAGAAGPASLSVFERASGEPLTKGIAGLFTKEGYRKAFETSVDKATRQLAAEETWVLGLRPSDASKSLPLGKANPKLTNRVRRLYFEEYIKIWDKYIADVRVVKLDSLEKSLQVARQLSGIDSPLAAFLRGVARETTLVEPKPAVALDQRHQVGNVDQKADQAKREMARCSARSRCRAPTSPRQDRRSSRWSTITSSRSAASSPTPPPMDEIMKMFNDVYVQLARRRGAEKQSAPPPGGGGERIKRGGQLPEPARSAPREGRGCGRDLGTRGRARGPDQRAQADQRVLQPGDHRTLPVHLQLEGGRAAGRLRAAVRRWRRVRHVLHHQAGLAGRHRHQPLELRRPATAPSRSMPRPWSTSSVRRGSRKCSSAAAARRPRSRSTSVPWRWKTA